MKKPAIEVEALNKFFLDLPAIQDLSFSINPGEIVGLLGPNGAGKSTTMRMLTGFLPASSGRIHIAGFDIETHCHKAKRHIGYLPESVPLYPEMRVMEYLQFRARLKGITYVKNAVKDIIKQAFLAEKEQQIIGTLSKGYRQRVGLADALLGKPPILILDEPTEGLDPAQIKATRELISLLSQEHTVLLSSHILPEVEQICQRVLILYQGRLVADLRRDKNETKHFQWLSSSEKSLQETKLLLSFASPPAGLQELLKKLPGVLQVTPLEANRFMLCYHSEKDDPRDALLTLVHQEKLKLREMRIKRDSIEDIFIALTTKDRAKENHDTNDS